MTERPSSRWASIKGNIGVMLISSGLWNIAGAMTWPFYALYVLELGGMHADIGFISALGAVTRIVPTLFGGYLADALGRKKILYSMSFLLAINELLLAFVPPPCLQGPQGRRQCDRGERQSHQPRCGGCGARV